ncbi:MAG TPA: NAD(P)H-dependent oxidoreductase subunit E [Dehalococcoidia bacterium]|nr:NAD(P)H-dependent oxidoreductase subunit E [Dehalococcoidia bacterium]
MLDTEATLEIQQLVKDFKPQDGDLLGALHAVQHRYGYIPRIAMRVVARQLRMSEAKVFGCVTYYSEFRLIPPPETLIAWCSGPACRLKGGEHIRRVLETELGIGMGENTEGDRLGLHLGQCNGTCEHAPQVWLNGEVVGPLSVAETVQLVRDLKEGTDRG